MSTAIALPPSNHNSPLPRESDPRHSSATPRHHHSSVSSGRSPGERVMSSSSRHGQPMSSPSANEEPRDYHVAPSRQSPLQRQSPPSASKSTPLNHPTSSNVPVIKKEQPNSPEPPAPTPTSRHRPQRLDLSTSSNANALTANGRPSAPLTSKESAPLSAIQDVGIACLSPGFQTQDPTMQQQLQRSMDVREQQRHIIEARLNKSSKDSEGSSSRESALQTSAFPKPLTSKRKRPPPGLSINAPSAHQFAGEPRTVQSAPLNQSFTGLRGGPSNVHPLSRHIEEPHSHGLPSHQSATASHGTRLPPIADVISSQESYAPSSARPTDSLNRTHSGPAYGPLNTAHKHSPQSTQEHSAVQSPGLPPSHHNGPSNLHVQTSGRPREYKSAEEAVQSMTGGREDLLPKIVHYGGHQPPTPPSPLPPTGVQYPSSQPPHPHHHHHHHHHQAAPASATVPSFPGHLTISGRRRTREEYERDQESGGDEDPHSAEKRRHSARQYGPFGAGRDSPDTQLKKKDEFLALCSRAWDLFHS